MSTGTDTTILAPDRTDDKPQAEAEPTRRIFASHGEPEGLSVADLRFRVWAIQDLNL